MHATVLPLLWNLVQNPETAHHHFHTLKSLMDQLTATDFNLAEKMANLNQDNEWSFETLYTTEAFEINLLMIPRGCGIPLHDHPQMNVLLKVLWGTLYLEAYDWAEEYPFQGLARLTQQNYCNGATETLWINPKQNNLHEIYAVEDCAFLDILFPPYSETRPCHYYKKKETLSRQQEHFVKLVSEPS